MPVQFSRWFGPVFGQQGTLRLQRRMNRKMRQVSAPGLLPVLPNKVHRPFGEDIGQVSALRTPMPFEARQLAMIDGRLEPLLTRRIPQVPFAKHASRITLIP